MVHVAWAGSPFSLSYAVSSLFSGPLSDRFGRKQAMFTGLLMLTISTFAVPIFNNSSWVIALRTIQGFAAAE
ncbi:MFS transporter [Pseudogracilibacillus auburnensis]|uniref:MFS transporter n=1 Tax=Pseudogracilibacillus auburnensis TaxID=1494959 RepID=UPI001A96833E|nr:MFS transporter [Pseudogracilibacillus auburnensis]